MLELVDNLLKAFDTSIDGLDWMSADDARRSEEEAGEDHGEDRLSGQVARLLRRYTVRRDDLVGNVLRAAEFEHQRYVARTGGPVDKGEWLMTPQTVNAYYNPTTNEITFPGRHPAAAVLRHERRRRGELRRHRLGDRPRDQPRLRRFGPPVRRRRQPARLVDGRRRRAASSSAPASWSKQFAGYTVLDNRHLNGELTLGENIGDLSGMAVAFKAYQLSLARQTGAGNRRLHRASSASSSAGRRSGAASTATRSCCKRLVTDPHSPSEFRTNGPTSNIDAFYDAFGVKPGDRMYRPPERACQNLVSVRARPRRRFRCAELTMIARSCSSRRAAWRRLRLQQAAAPGRGGEGRLVRSGQPVPAARGSDPEPRRHREGFRRAGSSACSSASPRRAPRPLRSSSRPSCSTTRRPSQKFQAAQGELTQALKSSGRRCENYPELKSDANFRDLQVQLEGTENRITVARNRYIDAVRALQRHGARVPDEPHRDAVRLRSEAELHRGERGGDLDARPRWTSTPPRRRSQPRRRAGHCSEPRKRPPRRPMSAVKPPCCRRCSRACWRVAQRAPAERRSALPTLEARVTDLTGTLTADAAGRARGEARARSRRARARRSPC